MDAQKMFQILELKNISPDELYYIYCLISKKTPINIMTSKIQRSLINKKIIGLDEQGNLQLTLDGNDLVHSFGLKNSTITTDYIDEYREIFPKGMLPSGVPSRINRKNLTEAFKWFFKTYDYSWDIILKATKAYVEYFEKTDYKFMQNSQYFIRKVNSDKTVNSTLATYCDLIIQGDAPDNDTHRFSEKAV